MLRIDGEQLARQRVRLGIDGFGAEEFRPHVVQLQPAAHVGLVDEPQHRRPVLVGHQQPQTRAAQHLLDCEPPAGLVGLEVQQFGDVGQFAGVGTDCGADVVAHRECELRQRRADVLDALEFLGGVVAGDAGGLLGVLGVGGCLAVAFDLGEHFGGLGEQFLAQVPELVGGVGNVDVVGGEQVFVGGTTALDLLGLGLGGSHLGLQRGDVRAGAADLRVERIRLGLGQIQLRVTSSYSFSSWSMVPSSVAIWVGHCASRTWSVNARTMGASTRSMMPRSEDSEA